MQQLGETAEAMEAEDQKAIEAILNKRPTGNYWILLHYKSNELFMPSGERILNRAIKVYNTKPPELIGTIVHEVKNGEIVDTDVSLPDAPIDWESVLKHAGLEESMAVETNEKKAQAYLYNY